MAKTTVPLRAADGSSRSVVGESLPGGVHLVQHVATAMRTVLGYGFANVTAAVALPNIPVGATHAFVTIDAGGGALRWRSDATNPAAAATTNANAGLVAAAGSAVELALSNLANVRVVAVSGTATINVEYSKLDG
jgi:hypothetical protein